MTRRNFAIGLLGWAVPGLVAVPLGMANGGAVDQVVFVTVLAWWALSVIGSLVAGVVVATARGDEGTRGAAFRAGLGGIAVSWIGAIAASVAVDQFVFWLDIGAIAVFLPIPLVLGYVIGFGASAVLVSRSPQ